MCLLGSKLCAYWMPSVVERCHRFLSWTSTASGLQALAVCRPLGLYTTPPGRQTLSVENLLHPTVSHSGKGYSPCPPNYLIYWSNSQPFFRQWMHLSPPSPRAKVHGKSLETLSPAFDIKLYTKVVQVQVRLALRFRGWKIHLEEIYDNINCSTTRSSHGSNAVLTAGSYITN